MKDIATISRLLNDVRSACDADARQLAGEPARVEELAAMGRTATGMLNEFVLRFGIIGESNAGKSRLIGGLIGRADALPVNAFPYTGNIAILRIRSDDSLTATAFGAYGLRFMSAASARECLAHLLATFLRELEEMTGTSDLVRTGRDRQRQLDAAPMETELLAWLGKAWQAVADRGLNVRLRLTELARFILTWQRLGGATGGKEVVVPERKVAEKAMTLPKQVEASRFADFVKAVNDGITAAIGTSARLAAIPAAITEAFAEVCYPLVQDIRIEVRVPQSVWDLARLHVDAIELFDFPGLAAQGTSARDTFLSLRERRQNRIHTWVIVVNSAELKGCQAVEIIKDLPADRVVAVANLFDALPLLKDGQIAELDRMIAPNAPPLKERDVLHRMEVLTPLTTIFERLTRPERCVLVSAMLGLMELDQMPAVRGQVLTGDHRKYWPIDLSNGREAQPKWGTLAEKVLAVEKDAALAQWLSTYATPGGQGGLVRFRQILFEHANAVGLVQLTEEMNRRLAELGVTIKAFLLRAGRQVEESTAKANEVRSALDRLLTEYVDNANPPSSVEDIRVQPMGPERNGRLNPKTRMLAPQPAGPAPLSELIRDEVLMRVWDWGAWKALLDSGREDGFVDGSIAQAADDDGDRSPWESAVAPAPPMRAGELHGPFCEAYADVEAITVAALRSSLLDFLNGLSGRLSSLAVSFAPLASSNPKNVINFALKPQEDVTVKHLFKPVAATAPLERPTDPFWRDRFPFLIDADEHGKLTPGPFFGWSAQRREVVRNRTEHQMYVMRLRTELSTAIEAGVTRQAGAALLGFRGRFNEMRKTLALAIDQMKSQSNANLLALFGKTTGLPRPEANLALRNVSDQLNA